MNRLILDIFTPSKDFGEEMKLLLLFKSTSNFFLITSILMRKVLTKMHQKYQTNLQYQVLNK